MTTVTMTEKKLSKRAEKAIEILRAGGKYICQLETNSYTRRTQWQYRLHQPNSAKVVPGFGCKTWYELEHMLTMTFSSYSYKSYELRPEYR
jgi:hypothetical protein